MIKRSGFYPKYQNKAQEIFHNLEDKHQHRKPEFIRILKHEFIQLCLEDDVVDNYKKIIKPPVYIRYI